jgi:hypothetical protein
MTREYIKPATSVVELQQQWHILAGSVKSMNSNLDDDGDGIGDLLLGGGSSIDARSRSIDDWDDDSAEW